MNIFVENFDLKFLVLHRLLKFMKKSIFSTFIFMITVLPLQGLKAIDVVFNVVVPSSTNQCLIVGNFVGWNIVDAKKCSKIDQTHYRIILNDSTWNDSVTISNLKYLYLSHPCDWMYVERAKDGNFTSERTYEEGVNDTVAKWIEGYYEEIVPFRVTTPKGTRHCYLYGNVYGQNIPVGNYELDMISVNSDSTVVFLAFLAPNYLTCDNTISYRFCSGPGLDYDQLIPSANFGSSDVNPVVYAWKATYTAVNQQSASNVSISSNASDIIIDGTEVNDIINVYSITGLKIRTYKSVGERIVFAAQKNEIYFVTTHCKSAKIVVK